MNKLCFLAMILALGMLTIPANALSTIVPDVYTKSFTVTLPDASLYLPSCSIVENFEAGACSYVYGCYAVLPKGSSDFDHAILRDCVQLQDSGTYIFNINFVPPKGKIYAVTTFNSIWNYTYNDVTHTWIETYDIPTAYISAEEIVSLCPDGKMLKSNLCIPALEICVDKLGTNLCTSPYTLYALDYDGDGFEDDMLDASHICADREDDKICDEVVDEFCADTNHNGICDSTDIELQDTACVDANGNGVCDDVETEGTFCKVNYDPVCANDITYPNPCFADAAGIMFYTPGECLPLVLEIQCMENADCMVPCLGVVSSCNNYQCVYSGECNPSIIQCTTTADCPAPYCVGVSATCVDNDCEYEGKCITKPEAPPNIWDKFKALFNNLILQIMLKLGWL